MRRPSRATVLLAALLIALVDVAVLVDRTSTSTYGPVAAGPADQVAEQYAEVAAAVARLRGLSFTQVPTPTYLSRAELAARAATLADAYAQDRADDDAALLATLGAIAPGTDLRALLATALGEGVAGFYDPGSHEMVVGTDADAEPLGPLERLTLAHELSHALVDQRIGLPDEPVDGQATEDADDDRGSAVAALVEGDATRIMQLYAAGELNAADHTRLLAELDDEEARLRDAAQLPVYVESALAFPYTDGLAFVVAVTDEGGMALLDAAYADPPTTTAQILFPERYRNRELAVPPAPASDPAGWTRHRAPTFGALDLLLLFDAPGDDRSRALATSRRDAGDWRGGRAVLWRRDEEVAVGVHLVPRGSGDLCAAVVTWYQRAFDDGFPVAVEGDERLAIDGQDQDAVVKCGPDHVRLGIGPDLTTARAAAA